jgi:tetratricopeptide (TPR) repeat protein
MKGLGMKKRAVLWVLVILLLVGGGVAAALFLTNRRDVTTTSRAAYEAFEEASMNQKRFYTKEARVGFAKALQLDPSFSMAMLSLAELSDRDQALTLVRRAARERDRLTPRERYHVDIALASWEGKPDVANALAKELRAKYPADAVAAGRLAGAALVRGDRDEAIRIYEQLLTVDPNYAEAYNQIGYFYGYRGDYEKAIDNLTKYQFISPDNANPFDSLAENQANAGRYNEAIENLNRALAIKPDFEPAYWHLGVAYEGMGETSKAVASYEKASELATNDGMRQEYLTLAVRAALEGGQKDVALDLIARIEKIPVDPKSEAGRIGPGLMLAVKDLAEGRGADAERRMREIKPKIDAMFDEYAKAGKTGGRKAHFPEWNYVMACALEQQGKTDEALSLYEANANPPNPFLNFYDRRWVMEARAKVAEIVARKGDLDRAEKLIAENRKWNPSWAPCRKAETEVAELRRAKVLAAAK